VRAHRRRRPRAAVHEVAWLTGPVGPPRLSRLARWRVAAAVVVGLAAAALYHPPVAVIAPGPTFDAARDIEVTGVPVTPVHGRYLVTTVQAQRPTVLGVVSAVARAHDRVVGLDRLDPPGLGRQEASRRRHEAFRASQDAAVAAATHLAGITGGGIEVRFRPRSVGGPSAGLAYALALTDLLDGSDLAAGRTVVVTGALEPGGAVRPVGFVGEKALAGRRARASLLLVPEDQVGDALAAGVQVRGVTSLGEAVGDLRTP